MGPSLSGFLWFLRNIVGIPVIYLPDDAPVISWSYDISTDTVNPIFRCAPAWQLPPQQKIYTQLVYNLGAHDVISWAPDVQPPPTPPFKIDQSGQPVGYFEFMRQQFGLNSFLPGIVTAAYDQGTGTSLMVPDSLKNLTIADLALTKTPWGRTYLGTAQDWNRPWGIS